MDKTAMNGPERVVELSRYVPEFLRDYTEFRALYGGEEEELRELYKHFDSLWTASLIKEADRQGVIRYEKLLGLASDSRLTLEERRTNILMKWNRLLPYTLKRLGEQLKLWSGDEPFVLDTSRFKEYELRIEVFNQSPAALRGIKATTEEMIPANLILFLYGRYPSEFKVPIQCDNAIHYQTAFHPRYNLPFLHLDRTWNLDNVRRLNGYDSGDVLDFYPVGIRIQSDVNADIRAGQRIQTIWANPVDVETENALHLKTEAGREIRSVERVKVQTGAVEAIEISSGLELVAGVEHNLQIGESVRYRSHAAGEVQAQEQFTLRSAAAHEFDAVSHMTKINQMDSEWKLDGSRKLDGGNYTL